MCTELGFPLWFKLGMHVKAVLENEALLKEFDMKMLGHSFCVFTAKMLHTLSQRPCSFLLVNESVPSKKFMIQALERPLAKNSCAALFGLRTDSDLVLGSKITSNSDRE